MQESLRAAFMGNLGVAEKLILGVNQEDPQSASVWSNRGSVCLSLGLFKNACGEFTQNIQVAPEAPVLLLNRAIALEALPSGCGCLYQQLHVAMHT